MSRGGWNTKIHMIAATELTELYFSLSGGQARDMPEGRALLERFGERAAKVPR